MQKNKLFYKYYDIIFSKKDYKKETDYILNLWYKYNQKHPISILDFGCGTGSHTLTFADRGFEILGYDINENMIKIANSKRTFNSEVKFIFQDILDADIEKSFDIIYSYFFVINYITDITTLEAIFKKFYTILNHNGTFLFDLVNGEATCKYQPKIKEVNAEYENILINGFLYPKFNSRLNSAEYHYDLTVIDNDKRIKVDYFMNQVYWSPSVLISLLTKCGFKSIKVFKHLTDIEGGGSDDYKISLLCVK